MKKYILIFLSFLYLNFAFSQDSLKRKILVVQPKIMVIPFAKEGEDIRNLLENDINKRIALTKIKEAFDLRGFTTVDFFSKLKSANMSTIFNSSNQSDIKSIIINQSGADIYISAEINYQSSSSGNSIRLILSANEVSTGNSLANAVGFSDKWYTDDVARLTIKAIENSITEFLNVMQSKFTEIVNNGRSLNVEIGFDSNSKYNFASEFKNLPLSDLTEEWFMKNAYQENYHIQGTTNIKMILDDVKIPLKDPISGNNYNPNKFALKLYSFYKELGLEVVKDVVNSTIFITIK
jgi:hypothetical protein